MKVFAYIAVAIFLFGCHTLNKDDQNSSGKQTQDDRQNHPKGKVYFDYDQIDHYENSIDGAELTSFMNKWPESEIDTLENEVILGSIPTSIKDTVFIAKLVQLGYTKRNVDTSKFDAMNQIFCEKWSKKHMSTSCIYVYRNILVFKKRSKIVGIAKICFGCKDHIIVGTDANTYDFGQDGDYAKLEKILTH